MVHAGKEEEEERPPGLAGRSRLSRVPCVATSRHLQRRGGGVRATRRRSDSRAADRRLERRVRVVLGRPVADEHPHRLVRRHRQSLTRRYRRPALPSAVHQLRRPIRRRRSAASPLVRPSPRARVGPRPRTSKSGGMLVGGGCRLPLGVLPGGGGSAPGRRVRIADAVHDVPGSGVAVHRRPAVDLGSRRPVTGLRRPDSRARAPVMRPPRRRRLEAEAATGAARRAMAIAVGGGRCPMIVMMIVGGGAEICPGRQRLHRTPTSDSHSPLDKSQYLEGRPQLAR